MKLRMRIVLRSVIWFVASTAIAGSVCAQESLWVTDLDADPKLVGQEVVVEGSFQQRVGASREQILLKSCKIGFLLPPDVLKTVPSSLGGGLRIKGMLVKQEGKLVVRVKSLERISTTDVERYRGVAAQLRDTDSAGWYRLADRTQRLADAHESAELRGLAAGARRRGFRADELAVTSSQPDVLLRLADRADDLGLGVDESRRLRHKALTWKFDGLVAGKPTAADWRKLEGETTKLLPGSQKTLRPEDAAIIRRYRAKPLDVYESDPDARDAFDRDLYSEIASRGLLAAALEPDSDPLRLSEEAKRRLPERPELWHQLLLRWAEAEATEIANLPPAKLSATRVRKLADVFSKSLNLPDRANDVFRKWLDARRAKIGRSADGRVLLARDYRTFLGDVATAAKLLLEAIEIEPDLPQAVEDLKALGYVKGPSGWIRSADRTAAGSATPAPTPRGRLPEPGMSPEQVRAIPGLGKPDEVLRFATAGRVVEQWSYKGPPDIHVTFLVASTGAKVLSINTPARK